MAYDGVKDVEAVDDVAFLDGQFEGGDGDGVGLPDPQRRVQIRQEVFQTGKGQILRRLLVVLLPNAVKHLDVVLRDTCRHGGKELVGSQ